MEKNDGILKCFEECNDMMGRVDIPMWEDIPEIDLYMDQTVELVNKYLKFFSRFLDEDYEVTRPMINNYVKLRIMPAPEKKKYSRKHLAYILVICILKQTLNISAIQKIMPPEMDEQEVHYRYNAFVKNQEKAFNYIKEQIDTIVRPIYDDENIKGHSDNLVMQAAASANILKCVTERVIKKC